MGLTTLETKRIRADMIEVYKMLNGLEGIESWSMFIKRVGIFIGGHSQKLFKNKGRLDMGKYFSNRVSATEFSNVSATEFVMSGIVCRVR